MRGFRRRFATLLAATILVSGLSFAQVSAEETEATEPVPTQEMVQMEQSGEFEAAKTDADLSEVEDKESNIRLVAVPGGNGNRCSIEVVPASEITTAQVDFVSYTIDSMDALVAALGASNVSVISGTEIKLLKDISIPTTQENAYDFTKGTYVIDFDGHTVTGIVCFSMCSGSNVTFKDSTGTNAGGIVSLPVRNGTEIYYSLFPISMSEGKATILSGKYVGYSTSVLALKGELRIEGGIIEPGSDDGASANIALDVYSDMTKVEITGGLFRADLCAVSCSREMFSYPDTSVRTPLRISGGTFVANLQTQEYGAITYLDSNTEVTPDMNELIADDCYIVPSDLRVYRVFGENIQSMNVSTALSAKVENPVEITNFVNRLYTMVLGRSPDPVGKRNWVTQLMSGELSGADAAYGFFFSPELTNRSLTNREFVTLMYYVFLNRTPDAGGLQSWVSALETGASRKYVFAGFANSQEWKNLCAVYKIEPGSFASDEPRDQNLKVTAFVQRLYTRCLDRSADVSGLNYWSAALLNKTQDGAHVAHGFFFSQEFIGKNLSNAEFIEVLYKVLLGRGSDSAGKADWVAQLNAGTSRMNVFRGFVYSQEFNAICAEYGIVRGEI